MARSYRNHRQRVCRRGAGLRSLAIECAGLSPAATTAPRSTLDVADNRTVESRLTALRRALQKPTKQVGDGAAISCDPRMHWAESAAASSLTHQERAAVSPLFHRIAMARRAVRELVAIAEQRAAAADSKCAATSFRPLTDSETEALVGADLLATLAASASAPK